MTQNELKLSKDLGDIGDQLSEKANLHLPYSKGERLGLPITYPRVRAQGYDIDDVEILWTSHLIQCR